MKFGDVLRRLLENNHMTQKQLSQELNLAATTLGGYIRNLREPDFETLKRIAAYFHVSVDYLLDYHEDVPFSGYNEAELLMIYRALSHDQQELFLEQGKVLLRMQTKTQT